MVYSDLFIRQYFIDAQVKARALDGTSFGKALPLPIEVPCRFLCGDYLRLEGEVLQQIQRLQG